MNITPYHSESKKSKYNQYFIDTSPIESNFPAIPEDNNNNCNRTYNISNDSHHELPQQNFELSSYDDTSSVPPNLWSPLQPPPLDGRSLVNNNSRSSISCPYDQYPTVPISHTQNIMNMLHSNHLRR
jgi:hypothetical protein